jgi:glyoxalase family protein
VKQTVNFDQPSSYHLYDGDAFGCSGSIMTFFEFAGVAPGRTGDGMIHRVLPAERRLLGFEGARAYASDPERSAGLLAETLGLERGAGRWLAAGDQRRATYTYDEAPADAGVPGGGTVHHLAWASRDGEHKAWRSRVLARGARVTPIIDRDYFRSIYFREPSGVLFEIATLGPGFTVDEPADRLGESLRLPRQREHLRGRLERTLTPLENPRPQATVR